MKIEGKTDRIELGAVEITQEVEINTTPEKAFKAMTEDIGLWWSNKWCLGGPTSIDLVLEPWPGGRFIEIWSYDEEKRVEEGSIWANVIAVRRNSMIRLGIPDGVMWSGPGEIVFEIEEIESGIKLTVIHGCTQVYSEDGHEGYQAGWTELTGTRLKKYLEGEKLENIVRH